MQEGSTGARGSGDGRRFAIAQGRDVRACGDRDFDQVVGALAGVVGLEPIAEAARFDANDRIDARVVVTAAVEDDGADEVFLQLVGGACEDVFDGQMEEASEAARAREVLARDDALQLLADGFGVVAGGRRAVLRCNLEPCCQWRHPVVDQDSCLLAAAARLAAAAGCRHWRIRTAVSSLPADCGAFRRW
jgi:hypothetical protein